MKIGIVGGGITGLACGYYLSKMGHEINVFEENIVTGGLAKSFEITENTQIETQPIFFSKTDKHLLRLLNEFDLNNAIIWGNTKTGAFFEDQVLPFTSTVDLLKFKKLSYINKTKTLFSNIRIALKKGAFSLDTISAKEWIIRNCGAKSYEILWQNMFETRFKGLAHAVPTSWFWAKERKRLRNLSNFAGYQKTGYFQASTTVLFESLIKAIIKNGGSGFTGQKVSKVDISSKKIRGLTADGKYHKFDRIILTVSTNEIKTVAAEAYNALPEKIRQLEYSVISTLVLQLKRQFSDYFKLSILELGMPFYEIYELTNLRAFNIQPNNSIISIPNYFRDHDKLNSLRKNSLIESYIPYLKQINKNFSESDIVNSHLFTSSNADPYYFLNYASAILDFQSVIGGLIIANTSQIYPKPRSLDSCIKNAKRASEIAGY
jgi:protoporphyrinogen oxidase